MKRVRIVTTSTRWYDVDGLEEEDPRELEELVVSVFLEDGSVVGGLTERTDEQDHDLDVTVYGVCEEHDRVEDFTVYDDRTTPACSACWHDGYLARHPEERPLEKGTP